MAGRAKENLPRGSLKYLFVYLKIRIFKNCYRTLLGIKSLYFDDSREWTKLTARWGLNEPSSKMHSRWEIVYTRFWLYEGNVYRVQEAFSVAFPLNQSYDNGDTGGWLYNPKVTNCYDFLPYFCRLAFTRGAGKEYLLGIKLHAEVQRETDREGVELWTSSTSYYPNSTVTPPTMGA